MRRSLCLLGLTAGLLAGCGGGDSKKSAMRFDPAGGEMAFEPATAAAPQGGGGLPGMPGPGGALGGRAGQPAGAPPQPAKEAERKVIFEGTLAVIVPEIDPAAEQVRATAKRFEAYISASDVSGSAGTRRDAHFTIHVPADKFEDLREALAKLGEVTRNSSKSADVTEEFYDLDARIKVLKQEEEALKELLKKDAGKLDELLKVRDHLTRNREQIERAEGRQRYLSAKVAYSTVTVTLSETKDYIPPTSPTYGSRLSRTFWDSVEAMEDLGKGIVTFLVAVGPWSPLILLAAWLIRRAVKQTREPPVLPVVTAQQHRPADPPGSGQ